MLQPDPSYGYLSSLVAGEPRHLAEGTWPLQAVRSARIALPVGLAAPRFARDAVVPLFGPVLAEHELSDLRLVITELVANGMRHGGDPVVMHVALSEQRLRVEVCDNGRWPDPPSNLGPAPGFGLNIVDQVAARWGVATDDGTCVWAEFDRPAHPGGRRFERG